jgi:cell division protein FtsQ
MSSLAPQTERSARSTPPVRRRAGRPAAPRPATSPRVVVDRSAPATLAQRALRVLKATTLIGVAVGSAAAVVHVRSLVEASDVIVVQEIRVSGSSEARIEELRAYADVPPGTPLLAVDPEVVAARVARHPWVARAEVRRALPDALEIAVVERTARALLRVGDGLYLVDEHGEVMKRVRPGDAVDHPLLTLLPAVGSGALEGAVDGVGGDVPAGDVTAGDGAATAPLPPRLGDALAVIAAADAAGVADRVSEMLELPAVGFELVLDDGARARVGNDLFEDKLRRLVATEERLRHSGRRFSFMYLDDARHPERVAVRLRPVTETSPTGG